jgi:hypothetical protein
MSQQSIVMELERQRRRIDDLEHHDHPDLEDRIDDLETSIGTGARRSRSTNHSVSNATATALGFLTWDYQHGGTFSVTGQTRVYAPRDGVYSISGNVYFAANATGFRWAYLRRNGSTSIAEDARNAVTASGVGTLISVATDYYLSSGDYIELIAYQNSGGTLNVYKCHLSMSLAGG